MSRHRRAAGLDRYAVASAIIIIGAACSDQGPQNPLGNGGGNQAPQRQISVLGYAPDPSRLLARNGALYWLDTSDEPLSKLTLPDQTYTPLVTALPHPESAVPDGQYVYWLAGGFLYRTSNDGTVTTLLHEGERDLATGVTAAIVMDATHLYWANTVASGGCNPACTFVIRRMPKAGGVATTLTTTAQAIVALAIDAGHVFWEEQGIGPVNEDGSVGSAIKKVAIAGGAATALVNGLLNGLIPSPSPGFSPATWHARGGIALDGSSVYFADADFVDSYRVMSVPVTGGSVAVLAEVVTGDAATVVRDMELDDSDIFWVDGHSLRSMPKGGGSHVELAATPVTSVSLARLDGSLVWLETACCAHRQTGTIKSISIAGGTPAVVKTDLTAPVSVSADLSHLYWVEGGSIGAIEGFARIARAAPDGTGETVVMEAAGGGPFDVDDTHLYFANDFTIKRVSIAGGQVERLAIGDFYVTDVATDGAYVYWVEDPGATVRRMPVNGGPVTTLASGSGPAGAIRLDATHVYWMDHEDAILRVPKGGGSPTTVVEPVPGGLTDFVVSGATVYFAEWDGARIRQAPVTGGAATTLDSRPFSDQMRRMTTDGVSVYWIDQLDVGRIPTTGGTPDFIVLGSVESDPFMTSGLAVDGTNVYWTEVAGQVIKQATPK